MGPTDPSIENPGKNIATCKGHIFETAFFFYPVLENMGFHLGLCFASQLEKTANILRRHRIMMSEKWAQKFHIDDPSLFKSEWCFWLVLLNEKFSLTHQKHHPDLRSDVSSVWNFCTCFSDLILRQTRGGITKCWQILRPFASLSHIISFFSNLV